MHSLTSGILVILLFAGAPSQQEKPAENPEKRISPSKKNAAAEELESLVLALGLDAHRNEPSAEHPSREDIEAYQRAGLGSWLDAQLTTSDDSIASVPANIRSYLDKRQATLWRVAGLLERDVPQWDSAPRTDPRELSGVTLAVALARILMTAALVEEHAGHHGQAGDLLEACWSLSRSFSGQSDLTSQLMAVALGKFQAGVLRKMSESPVQWLDRMSGVEPWRGMLDTVEAAPFSARSGDVALDESRRTGARAWSAAMDRLRGLSPCEVSKLSDAEIWKPAREEIARSIEEGGDPSLRSLWDFEVPNITRAIQRAGRLLVDRELTAKVLELRQEKVASRDGRWPEKFLDLDSRVCPGVSYEYQTRGAAMAVRFQGPIDDGGATLVLPLSFEARAPRPTPTPIGARRPAVTPRPRS